MPRKKSALEEYPLGYEEPETKPRPLARPKTKPKQNKVNSPLVRKVKEMAKESRKYQPTRMEVAKTVIIAVLITAVIAFIAGTHYQQSHQAEIQNAVHAAMTNTPVKK